MTVAARPRGRAHSSAENGPHVTPVGSTSKIGTPSNAPGSYRVCLFDQTNGRLQRVTWSAPATGQYQFRGLRASTYFALVFDHTGQYNGEVVTDVVLPAPGV